MNKVITWENGKKVIRDWTPEDEAKAVPAIPRDVKKEAARRILAICPEWKQRNLTAQAAILAAKGRENWTADELAAWQAGEAVWSQIAEIRAMSNAIEAMDPIPQDYKDDKHWQGSEG